MGGARGFHWEMPAILVAGDEGEEQFSFVEVLPLSPKSDNNLLLEIIKKVSGVTNMSHIRVVVEVGETQSEPFGLNERLGLVEKYEKNSSIASYGLSMGFKKIWSVFPLTADPQIRLIIRNKLPIILLTYVFN